MTQPKSDEFAYHSERARNEALAALAAENPRVAAIHVELATRHVRCIQSQREGSEPKSPRREPTAPGPTPSAPPAARVRSAIPTAG